MRTSSATRIVRGGQRQHHVAEPALVGGAVNGRRFSASVSIDCKAASTIIVISGVHSLTSMAMMPMTAPVAWRNLSGIAEKPQNPRVKAVGGVSAKAAQKPPQSAPQKRAA
jgi:hypothetical protein